MIYDYLIAFTNSYMCLVTILSSTLMLGEVNGKNRICLARAQTRQHEQKNESQQSRPQCDRASSSPSLPLSRPHLSRTLWTNQSSVQGLHDIHHRHALDLVRTPGLKSYSVHDFSIFCFDDRDYFDFLYLSIKARKRNQVCLILMFACIIVANTYKNKTSCNLFYFG